MEIKDKGFIIGQKKFGENGIIVNIFSENNGLIKGFKKYSPKKNKGILFDLVSFSWKSRIEDGLGYFKYEVLKSSYSPNEPYLFSLIKASVSELCLKLIPQREVNNNIFDDLKNLIKIPSRVKIEDFMLIKFYIFWEIKFLNYLGYGFDFSRCAVSGVTEDLTYISPKTGQVVSKNVGEPWKKKLLIFPGFLVKEDSTIRKEDLVNGLNLTYFFLVQILSKVSSNKKNNFIYRKQLFERVLNFKDLP